MKKEDTNWIYGLKFIAALVVIVHHFALYFYPAFITMFSWDVRTASAVELLVAKTPFNIFSWGGNVCVSIFFVISGFLISYKFFFLDGSKKNIGFVDYLNRYLKLAIPIFLSSIFYLVVINLIKLVSSSGLCVDVLGKSGSYCNFDVSFFKVFYESFISFFAKGNVSVNPVLWTMYGELVGSFVIMTLLKVLGDNKNRKYAYFVLLLLLYNSVVFPFLLGMILCDFYKNNVLDNIISKWYVKVLLVIFGIYFCGFTYQIQGSIFYKFLTFDLHDSLLFYHTLGAVCFILVVINSDFLKKILGSLIFTKYKNISFEVYLFHWLILNTYSISLMNILISFLDYKYAFLIMFGTSLILIYVMSYFVGEKILKLTGKYTKKICELYDGNVR